MRLLRRPRSCRDGLGFPSFDENYFNGFPVRVAVCYHLDVTRLDSV